MYGVKLLEMIIYEIFTCYQFLKPNPPPFHNKLYKLSTFFPRGMGSNNIFDSITCNYQISKTHKKNCKKKKIAI